MSTLAAAPLKRTWAEAVVGDERLAVMRSLVIADWLPGEWDPHRQLLIPSADTVLARARVALCGTVPP